MRRYHVRGIHPIIQLGIEHVYPRRHRRAYWYGFMSVLNAAVSTITMFADQGGVEYIELRWLLRAVS